VYCGEMVSVGMVLKKCKLLKNVSMSGGLGLFPPPPHKKGLWEFEVGRALLSNVTGQRKIGDIYTNLSNQLKWSP